MRNNILKLNESDRDMLVVGFLLSRKSRTTFLFSYAMSKKLYAPLCSHFEENGPISRVHGNVNRQPHNAFTFETREMVLNFIENFALANAVTLPGHVANYRDIDAKLLLIPSFEAKEIEHSEYKELSMENDVEAVGFSSFVNFGSLTYLT